MEREVLSLAAQAVPALVTMSEARKKLHEVVRQLPQRNVLLLKHGRPVATILDAEVYQELLEQIEDLKDRLAVFESAHEGEDMKVPWGKVEAEHGLLADE